MKQTEPTKISQLLTVDEAASRLRCSPRHVWRLMSPERRELERVAIGGMTRTTEQSVQRLIDKNKK
ncbi:helix-turn-helix domain-containing protein [Hyphomicrobium sp.]|uniref:helix-turn-helix domain-containing protein n=1 Tax=Hyphomicrobium sp. TaxID=82 RepID=UPI003569A962